MPGIVGLHIQQAVTDDGGLRATVETALVEPVVAGQRLLVHAGTAIARLPPDGDEVVR